MNDINSDLKESIFMWGGAQTVGIILQEVFSHCLVFIYFWAHWTDTQLPTHHFLIHVIEWTH